MRAVDVAAPVERTFRWVQQVAVAPYSYDLVDNLGRRSPRTLTPGAERLAVGDRFAVLFRVVEVVPDRLVRASTRAGRLLGATAMTYEVLPGPRGSRLVGRLDVSTARLLRRPFAHAMAWGDLVMMRKQLQTLASLAEQP